MEPEGEGALAPELGHTQIAMTLSWFHVPSATELMSIVALRTQRNYRRRDQPGMLAVDNIDQAHTG